MTNETKDLPEAAALDGTEVIAIYQGGQMVKVPLYLVLNLPTPVLTAAPTGFTATAFDDVQIDLAWTSAAANFILERNRGDNDAWEKIYEGSTVSFSDTGLTGDEHYYYRLTAQDVGEYQSPYVYADETTLSPP